MCDKEDLLIWKIEESEWHQTVSTLNSYYGKAEEINRTSIMETLIGCLTCYMSRIFMKTQYEKQLIEISKFIAEQNRKIYLPVGLHLTDPIERGFRVLEITLITTSPMLQNDEVHNQESFLPTTHKNL